MSIDSLKGFVDNRGGFARSNRFEINYEPLNRFDRDARFSIESITLPGRTIATDEISMHKQAIKMPYTFIDDPVTVTFLLTQDYGVKKVFDEELAKVFNSDTYRIGYKDDYSNSLTIAQLDRRDHRRYTLELEKAYPIQVGAIELSNAAENEIARLQVTFSYEKFRIR